MRVCVTAINILQSFSELTAANVLFMAQSVAEIFSTDPSLAYQQAFLYIRYLLFYIVHAIYTYSMYIHTYIQPYIHSLLTFV